MTKSKWDFSDTLGNPEWVKKTETIELEKYGLRVKIGKLLKEIYNAKEDKKLLEQLTQQKDTLMQQLIKLDKDS